MPTILISLPNFLTDPPIDLASLPPDEAADRIRHSFGWLASLIDVTIENNTATIHLAATDARRADQALATIDRAGALAERGKYNQAIPLYQEALKVLPAHTAARRYLAMAQMASGSPSAAKQKSHWPQFVW